VKKVLVTGATGFVGANLARRLVADGHEVHLLVRPDHTEWRLGGLRDRVRVHQVVLADAGAVSTLVDAVKPEWIFHLATHGAYSWETDVPRMVETTVIGTMNLVQACVRRGFEAFVNTGSSSEYGFKDHAPSETEAIDPNSDYAVNKAWATMFCRFTAVRDGLRMCTLRLYSVYGPWEEPRRLMPTLIVRGLRGELPPLVGPDTARDYVYVDDVVDAYLLAATRADQPPGGVYNVGSGVQTTLRQVVEVARRVLAVQAEPAWDSMRGRSWDTSVWVCDNRIIAAALGWRPHTPFEDGFRRMVEWMRHEPAGRQVYGAAGPRPTVEANRP